MQETDTSIHHPNAMEIDSFNANLLSTDLPVDGSSYPVPCAHSGTSNEPTKAIERQLDALSIGTPHPASSSNLVESLNTNSPPPQDWLEVENWINQIEKAYKKLERHDQLHGEFKKESSSSHCPPNTDPGQVAHMQAVKTGGYEIYREYAQLNRELRAEILVLLPVWRAIQERRIYLGLDRQEVLSKLVERYFGWEAFDMHNGLINPDSPTATH
ncbi:hypothetical protein HYFRA_00006586 [Hymenoscyphus fraxineus]|uniref:Uncharacterized protein n=1 Tax=Hymenoscyphus fraxineus TaxID=746836 RepID=A0A9N9KYA2_9HELO|nr:hypothetical protein HYFRA_00006586 [Hymenoscyphus fraxineus]